MRKSKISNKEEPASLSWNYSPSDDHRKQEHLCANIRENLENSFSYVFAYKRQSKLTVDDANFVISSLNSISRASWIRDPFANV